MPAFGVCVHRSARFYVRALQLNPSASHLWGYLRTSLSCAGLLDLMPQVGAAPGAARLWKWLGGGGYALGLTSASAFKRPCVRMHFFCSLLCR